MGFKRHHPFNLEKKRKKDFYFLFGGYLLTFYRKLALPSVWFESHSTNDKFSLWS